MRKVTRSKSLRLFIWHKKRINTIKKNPVSARPTENGKEIKGKTELIQTMIRLDLMPIPILNKYKSEKGTRTHNEIWKNIRTSHTTNHNIVSINVNEDKEVEIKVVT